MWFLLQRSNVTATTEPLNTFVVGNGHQGTVVSRAGGRLSAEHDNTTPNLPRASSTGTDCSEELDSEDNDCIPDTQFAQPADHPSHLRSGTFSPDIEMIPDTPDSASGTGVRKTFQRSYLASASNLLAACNGFPQKKISPPRKATTKGKCRLRKQVCLSTDSLDRCTDASVPGDVLLQSNISPSVLQPAAVANVPYPSCDALNKRCTTDPLPRSKRCDHKVTPTKTGPSTNSDVYGTVPCQLFREALSREKRQHLSNPRTNKENSEPVEDIPKLPDPDSDPVLLEVLGELKMDSPKEERPRNGFSAFVPPVTNNNVCENSLSGFHDATVDKCPETMNRDDDDNDLEDILGELRQQTSIRQSTQHARLNDAGKNQPSPSLNDAKKTQPLISSNDVNESPSSVSHLVPSYLSSVNNFENRNLAMLDEGDSRLEMCDLKPTESRLDQRTDNSAESLNEAHVKRAHSDSIDGRLVNGVSVSCLQSVYDDVNDNKIDEGTFSADSDQKARYISDYSLCRFCESSKTPLSDILLSM